MPKAQFFSLDLLVGAGVLLFLLTAYLIFLSDFSNRANSFEAYRSARIAAAEASSALAESPGEPADWQALASPNSSSIGSMGLCSQTRLLDNAKLAKLSTLAYNESKSILGLDRFEFRVSVLYANGTAAYQTGLTPQPEVQTIVVDRMVAYNNSPARLRLEVWI